MCSMRLEISNDSVVNLETLRSSIHALCAWTVCSHGSLGMSPGDVLDNSRQKNKARLVSSWTRNW